MVTIASLAASVLKGMSSAVAFCSLYPRMWLSVCSPSSACETAQIEKGEGTHNLSPFQYREHDHQAGAEGSGNQVAAKDTNGN